ncbi:gluconokinase [Actinotignum urinale]|uniref:Gluconokinase n=1 Tax=Actinotignum urinale TaxID=190146 RepID=A0AAW9HWJ8_9ACTO|nr:gluconokinase [Actinotignum urinale]MDY5128979.1 gluconokinase [Actinotignum urinale]MDY5154780.1 gluconokinase [Actinotignum urinale]WIK58671.1 gluconokinase [Actinotignum urinale]
MHTHVIIMGVAGCGKTTVAEAIRNRLRFILAEGDEFHPQANINKMSAGHPLNDEDRWPWLRLINTWMQEEEAGGRNTVVSCSALKRVYRDVLKENLDVLFLHLKGSQELLTARMSARKDHFMPASLMDSQFATLEPLQPDENFVEISVDAPVETVVEQAVAAVEKYMRNKEERAKVEA